MRLSRILCGPRLGAPLVGLRAELAPGTHMSWRAEGSTMTQALWRPLAWPAAATVSETLDRKVLAAWRAAAGRAD